VSAEETLARIRALLEDEDYYQAKPHKAYDALMRIRAVLNDSNHLNPHWKVDE
jgi:hypothetical protein